MSLEEADMDWQATKTNVLDRNRHMLNNPFMSDVVLTCDDAEQKFFAHKYVLCTSSSVFNAMFSGGLAAMTIPSVHISRTDAASLREFLSFLYTDECSLTPYNIVNVMYLAKTYNLPFLAEQCQKGLQTVLKPSNVLGILEQALYYEQTDFVNQCWQFVETCTSEVVGSDDFYDISQATLLSFLKRKNIKISERQLFEAVLRWSDYQCSLQSLSPTSENRRFVIGDAIYEIRFLAMTQAEFAQFVSPSGLLSTNEMVPIFQKFNGIDSPDLQWTKASREQMFTAVTCPKFSSTCVMPKATACDKTYFFLSFSVNQEALFHGVRLHTGENKVTLYIKRVDADGKQNSEVPYKNFSTGHIMFTSPVAVYLGASVMILAVIEGCSFGYYESLEKTVVEDGDLIVTFIEGYLPFSRHGGSYISEGQFDEIILSI